MEQRDEMVPGYWTIGAAGQGQIKRKGSLFIALADSVDDPEQVEQLVQRVSKQHPKASHHAYAYRIDRRQPSVRYSDDGEPGGTAGLPLVQLLEGRELTNSVLLVTRIFGGTLLGKGGLARAYADAGREALTDARTVKKILCNVLTVRVPYDRWGKLQHYLHDSGYPVDDVEYGSDVAVRIIIPARQHDSFRSWLDEFSGGAIQPVEEGKSYLSRR